MLWFDKSNTTTFDSVSGYRQALAYFKHDEKSVCSSFKPCKIEPEQVLFTEGYSYSEYQVYGDKNHVQAQI